MVNYVIELNTTYILKHLRNAREDYLIANVGYQVMVNYVIELNTTYILKHLRNAREDYLISNVAGQVMVNYVIELNTTYILKHLRNAREDYLTRNVAGQVMVNYVIELNTTYILKHLRNAREDYHTRNVAGMVSNGRSYNRIEYYLHPETSKKCSRRLPDSQRWLSGHVNYVIELNTTYILKHLRNAREDYLIANVGYQVMSTT